MRSWCLTVWACLTFWATIIIFLDNFYLQNKQSSKTETLTSSQSIWYQQTLTGLSDNLAHSACTQTPQLSQRIYSKQKISRLTLLTNHILITYSINNTQEDKQADLRIHCLIDARSSYKSNNIASTCITAKTIRRFSIQCLL